MERVKVSIDISKYIKVISRKSLLGRSDVEQSSLGWASLSSFSPCAHFYMMMMMIMLITTKMILMIKVILGISFLFFTLRTLRDDGDDDYVDYKDGDHANGHEDDDYNVDDLDDLFSFSPCVSSR